MPTNTPNNTTRIFTEDDARLAVQKIAQVKGVARAKLIEQMLRKETNHFKSRQYQQTGSAGMEDGAWGKQVTPYLPNGYDTIYFKDNHPAQRGTSKPLPFIVWDSVYNFCLFLSDYIDRYNGNYARWNSTNAARQAKYMTELNQVKSRFDLAEIVRQTKVKVKKAIVVVKDEIKEQLKLDTPKKKL